MSKRRSKPRRGVLERGAAMIEAAAMMPLFITTLFGVIQLDQMARGRRALEWAVGEAMLLCNFAGDVVDGSSTSGAPLEFEFGISAAGEVETLTGPSCGLSTAKNRCQAARETSILLARTLSDTMVGGMLGNVKVSFTYGDIPVSDGLPLVLAENRLLEIKIEAQPTGSPLGSILPTISLTRKEAIG